MDICLDSNVLIYSLNENSQFHLVTKNAISKFIANNDDLIVFPQNLIEFYSVATRPISSNGLGFAPVQAATELAEIRSTFHLISETPEIYPEWERLIVEHGVSGKNVHDARIAAQMNVHMIGSLLTFNARDFQRFTEIKAIEPASI